MEKGYGDDVGFRTYVWTNLLYVVSILDFYSFIYLLVVRRRSCHATQSEHKQRNRLSV